MPIEILNPVLKSGRNSPDHMATFFKTEFNSTETDMMASAATKSTFKVTISPSKKQTKSSSQLFKRPDWIKNRIKSKPVSEYLNKQHSPTLKERALSLYQFARTPISADKKLRKLVPKSYLNMVKTLVYTPANEEKRKMTATFSSIKYNPIRPSPKLMTLESITLGRNSPSQEQMSFTGFNTTSSIRVPLKPNTTAHVR
jgi:hypothetical protein